MTVSAFLAGAVVGLSVANVMWIRWTAEPTSISQWSQFRDALRRATRKDQP